MTPQARIRLATWTSIRGEHAITLGEEVSAAEAETVRELLLPFDALAGGVSTSYVQEAWTAFEHAANILPQRPVSKESDRAVLQAMVTWLAAFRTYLDHRETYWKRHYPGMAPAFKQATATEFDRADKCYAMTSSLRNYTSHVDTVGISIQHSMNPETRARDALVVGERDTLIERHRKDWHRTVLPVLNSMPETFDLMPVFRTAMQGLGRVHDASDNLLLLMAKESLEPLRHWADRAPRVATAGPSSPALIWECVDSANMITSPDLSLQSIMLLPHSRLDVLAFALTDSQDPLAAARIAFGRHNAESDASLGWPPASDGAAR